MRTWATPAAFSFTECEPDPSVVDGGHEGRTSLRLPSCRINWPLSQLASKGADGGVSRGEFSTRVLGGFWSISRAWSCQNEVRLGEDAENTILCEDTRLGGQLIRRNSGSPRRESPRWSRWSRISFSFKPERERRYCYDSSA